MINLEELLISLEYKKELRDKKMQRLQKQTKKRCKKIL